MLRLNDVKCDNFRLYYWHGATLVGKYELPQLMATQCVPHDVIGFNERKKVSRPENHWVDFFIDDHNFEGFWRHPEISFDNLRKFEGIVTTDFSMLPEMLPAQNIWNNTRNRVMAYYLQQNGFNIVPTASWCNEEDFDWCFDGLPEQASIAISTNGCLRNPYSRRIFMERVDELFRQKNPTHLIVCGRKMAGLEKYDNVIYYPCYSQRWQERKH